jgi:hypothetical protein
MRETYSGVGVVLLVSSLATPAQAGLTHRYSFNDGTAKDSVGGADGVAVNGAGFAGGQLVFNPAVNNGITTSPAFGQYVDLPNGLAKTRSLTLEVWFTYRGGNAWQRILDFGNTNMGEILPSNKTDRVYSAVGYMILVPQSSAGRLHGQITIASSGSLSDTDYVTPNTSVSTGVEHHLVFTHDPDEHLERMYLDGVLAGTSVADVDPSTTQYTNFWLGRSNFGLDPFFNGTINEFRIYDGALSTADVAQSFARGPDSVPEPSVLGAGLVAAVVVVTGRRRRSNDAATA